MAQITLNSSGVASSGSLLLQTNGTTTQATVDTSGNLGLGVTPSAWSSSYKTLQFTGGSISSPAFYTFVTTGAYYNGTNWIYTANDNATQYYQNSGFHFWRTAASGSAGGTVSFTQAMTLDSSGNLLVGTTSGVGSVGRGQFAQSSTANAAISADATSSSFAYTIAYFNTNTAAGTGFNFINCTTSNYTSAQFRVRGDGTIYAQNTTVQSISDERLKENIRDSSDGISVINALRPVRYDWKEGYGNDRKNQLGFIAQEVEAIFPEAVSEWQVDEKDETVYKTVGPGALIPVMVKAIQELKAIVDAQAARITALEQA